MTERNEPKSVGYEWIIEMAYKAVDKVIDLVDKMQEEQDNGQQ